MTVISADDEAAAERQVPAGLLTIGADAEEHQQKRQHDEGVAEDRAAVEAEPVEERQRREHHRRRQSAGDQAEGEDGFFHAPQASGRALRPSSSFRVIQRTTPGNTPFG
jgi:hypothetical protein